MAFSAAAAVKQGLLRHLRMPLQQACNSSSNAGASAGLTLWRGFAGGGYLDKDEVTQRVIDVTKHFEKIDPGKVRWVDVDACARSFGRQVAMISTASAKTVGLGLRM